MGSRVVEGEASTMTHLYGRKVIFLNGPPDCGKDTLANILVRHFDARHLKFSMVMKNALPVLFNSPIDWVAMEKTKNLPNNTFLGMSFREAQIWLSEEVMKPKFGEDIFGKLLLRRMMDMTASPFDVISDSGFEPEAQVIMKGVGNAYCYLINVHRPGTHYLGDSRSYISLPNVQTQVFHNQFPRAVLDKVWCAFVAGLLHLGDGVPDIVKREYNPTELEALEKWKRD